MSNVTGTPPNHPYPPQDPSGGFYLNQMAPPQPPKRGTSTGAILGIIAAVVAVLCVGATVAVALMPTSDPAPTAVEATTTAVPTTAPTTAAPPAPKTVTVQLGETLVYTSKGLGSDDEVHYTLAAGPQLTKTKFGSRPDKGVFFALTATIQAKKGSAFACSCDFALVAKDGTAYEPSVTYGFDGGLEAVQINTGQKAAGLVVWDLPQAALAGARVELRADLFADGNQGFWQLP
jgi:hypothetical protein